MLDGLCSTNMLCRITQLHVCVSDTRVILVLSTLVYRQKCHYGWRSH